MFFSPFSIAITSLGEERANLSAFCTFVRFVLVWICLFSLPHGVWEGRRFVIVALPGLFSYIFCLCLWHSLDFSFYLFFSDRPCSRSVFSPVSHLENKSVLFLRKEQNYLLALKTAKPIIKCLSEFLDIDHLELSK